MRRTADPFPGGSIPSLGFPLIGFEPPGGVDGDRSIIPAPVPSPDLNLARDWSSAYSHRERCGECRLS
jgi:hypothetical protein